MWSPRGFVLKVYSHQQLNHTDLIFFDILTAYQSSMDLGSTEYVFINFVDDLLHPLLAIR